MTTPDQTNAEVSDERLRELDRAMGRTDAFSSIVIPEIRAIVAELLTRRSVTTQASEPSAGEPLRYDELVACLRECKKQLDVIVDDGERVDWEQWRDDLDKLLAHVARPTSQASEGAAEPFNTGVGWENLSCDDQFTLATRIAANIGYELTPEPSIQEAEDRAAASPSKRVERLETAAWAVFAWWQQDVQDDSPELHALFEALGQALQGGRS